MYKKLNKSSKSKISFTPTIEGESIEEMLRRITANKEPIPQNVADIFTPKDEGVLPEYNIRTDRFDLALDAKDKIEASKIAKAHEKAETKEENDTEGKGEL